MFKTLRNAWKISEIRSKILFTLLIIALYRIGAVIPAPFVDYQMIAITENTQKMTEGIFAIINIFSGDAFAQAKLFALSVTPYINAQIIIQLLSVAIPKLEEWSKDGENGRRKIEKLTRILTVVLAMVTSIGYFFMLQNAGLVRAGGPHVVFKAIVMVASFTAGSSLVMWLGEKIDEQGIGNGISMILFANIVGGVPGIAVSFINTLSAATKVALWLKWVLGIGTLLIVVGSLIFVTYMSDAERKIPVQYAKRVVGRKVYGGQNSNLPIKLNMSGVMPIIFASTIVSFFPTVMYFVESIRGKEFDKTKDAFWYGFKHLFDSDSAVYIILLFVLIIAFSYFYISISFNPVEVANNLQQQGGFITGIRPGKPTAQYIKKVLNKIILMGAFFLGLIACVPLILNAVSGGLLGVVSFSGSTLLIVVGVILETVRELEAQLTMRHYKGFLE